MSQETRGAFHIAVSALFAGVVTEVAVGLLAHLATSSGAPPVANTLMAVERLRRGFDARRIDEPAAMAALAFALRARFVDPSCAFIARNEVVCLAYVAVIDAGDPAHGARAGHPRRAALLADEARRCADALEQRAPLPGWRAELERVLVERGLPPA